MDRCFRCGRRCREFRYGSSVVFRPGLTGVPTSGRRVFVRTKGRLIGGVLSGFGRSMGVSFGVVVRKQTTERLGGNSGRTGRTTSESM